MGGRGVAVVDNSGECRFGNDLSRDKQSGSNRDQVYVRPKYLDIVRTPVPRPEIQSMRAP